MEIQRFVQMKYIIIILLLASCKKPDTRCGYVVQIHPDAVIIRMDTINLIYHTTNKSYRLGDKICL